MKLLIERNQKQPRSWKTLHGTIFILLNVLSHAGVSHSFFVITPNDTLVVLGDTTQLNCTFSEIGHAAWYKGESAEHQKAITLENIIVDNKSQYEIIGDEDGADYHLRIKNVDMTSEGNYECGDQIHIGKRASAHLYVIKSAPVCSVQQSYIPRAGDNVTLTCSIDLNKNAPGELVWFKNGIEIHREEGQQSTMTIQLDKSDHRAKYDCGLQHFTLQSWKWSKLTCQKKIVMDVKYTASFIEANKTTFEVPVNDAIKLACIAEGFPTPNISWFDSDGDVIPGNEVNRKISTHSDDETRVTSILNINVVDESYYGIYKCQSFNEVASSGNQTFNILEQGRRSSFAVIFMITSAVVALVIFTAVIVGVCLRIRHSKKFRKSKGYTDKSCCGGHLTRHSSKRGSYKRAYSKAGPLELDINKFTETASSPTNRQSPMVGKVAISGNAGTSMSDINVLDVTSDETPKSTFTFSTNTDKEKPGKAPNLRRAKSYPV